MLRPKSLFLTKNAYDLFLNTLMYVPLFRLPQFHFSKFTSNQSNKQYWQQMLPKMEKQAQNIVKRIIQAPYKANETSGLLQTYLKLQSTTFNQHRTQLGVAAVLVAVSESNNSVLEYYTHRIVEFLCNSDDDDFEYDTRMINAFIVRLRNRSRQSSNKNRKSYYKLSFINLIENNLQKISEYNIYHVLKLLEDLTDKESAIDRARFLNIADSVQQKITQLLIKYQQKSLSNNYHQLQSIFRGPFVYAYILHLSKFGFKNKQIAQVWWKFMKSEVLTEQKLINIENFHKFITYYYNLSDCTIGCIPIRLLMLKKLQQVHDLFEKVKYNFKSINSNYKGFFFLRTFSSIFHQYLLSLHFHQKASLNYLLKSQIYQKPQVPSFIWQLYHQNKEQINHSLVKILISAIYPQQCSHILSNQIHINHKWIDNQTTLKVMLALEGLGLKYERQVLIMGRMVDYLISNEIILEFDGDLHVDFRTYQLNQFTAFRNTSLILGGYKLITLNIYEFNANRSLQQLISLISSKLQLIAQQDVIFVQ